MKILFLLLVYVLLVDAQQPGQGPGSGGAVEQTSFNDVSGLGMQSRAVDTRVQFEISEGLLPGTTVGFIPVKLGFTYRFNEAPAEFILQPATGEILTNITLDREELTNGRYDLVVLSSQPTYPIEVRILVTDINDNSPCFPETTISITFSESAAAGTRQLLDSASDLDGGINGVTDDYRILDGNVDDKFCLALSENPSGEASYLHLETTGRLDREACSFYRLNISARDGGNPPKFGFLQVNVTILDVNDNPPIFEQTDYVISLNESLPSGSPVLQVLATDYDSGDNGRITYYLADAESQFTVDSETGVVSTAEPLSCPQQICASLGKSCPKSCVFTVYARDHGLPRQDGRTYVTVNLVDANDHDPVIRFRYFPPTASYATVDENASNSSLVAAVSVEDVDEGANGDTTVRIVSGNDFNHFRMDKTGSFHIVRVNGALDREEISKYNLTVVAEDKGIPPRITTAFLIIQVNDVNDHEPVFDKSEYSAILSELSSPGTYVVSIRATDQDTDVNARIHYAFVSGDDDQGWFRMDPSSGLVTTAAPIDRELHDSITLNVSARDGGPNPKWTYTQLKVIILDENDEAPLFSQSNINVTLPENSPPLTVVATLTASDPDQGTNGSVSYSFHPIIQNKYSDVFSLDPLSGQLVTKSHLDRETESSYELHVIARDQGFPPHSATAVVHLYISDVNDNFPRFYPRRYFRAISENTLVGTVIMKVLATDADMGDNSIIAYTLESGDETSFAVNPRTGEISLLAGFRSSREPLHSLIISAKDTGDKRAAQNAIVEIIKEQYFTELYFQNSDEYNFKITEDRSSRIPTKGREVGRIFTNSDSVNYSIVFGDHEQAFLIHENNGIISASGNLDRETQNFYSLTILARSGFAYGQTQVNITILDLNDNAPRFSEEMDCLLLSEDCAIGQEIYAARARDYDAGINSQLTYAILTQNPREQFRISETTGVIYLNRPVSSAPGMFLNLEVSAIDNGQPPLNSTYILKFRVRDVNDHTPLFQHDSYETSLSESAPVNFRFFQMLATDMDLAENGEILYEIVHGNDEGKFGIFPDGYIYIRSALDREEQDFYILSILAKDAGDPPRSSEVPVVIYIIDENDNAPIFTNNSFTFTIYENEPQDTFVGRLSAEDRDIGRNAEFLFSLVDSSENFEIDAKSGFIKSKRSFDREQLISITGMDYIAFEVLVRDSGSTVRLSEKTDVKVYILDVNDNIPIFLRTPYRTQISEASPIGTHISRIYTEDADEGLNSVVFYSIIGGNEEKHFSVDSASGQITLAKILDREIIDNYVLTIEARDASLELRLNSVCSVFIEVLDENDGIPKFISSLPQEIIVSETTPIETELIKFLASDADLGLNADLTYSISGGNRRDNFRIDSYTGMLLLHKPLDFEELEFYTLNITATDSGHPILSTTTQIRVKVEDANDNSPRFPSTAIVRQIREGISIHTPIVTVTAEDPDSGANGRVVYAISAQQPMLKKSRHFGINPTTGVIHTLLPIDRESIDTFRLTIVATDSAESRDSRLSAEKLVTVIVEDINDNSPEFVSMNAALISHNASVGTTVTKVLALDADSSTNGLVTYALISGDTELFLLHRNTGAIVLKKKIDDAGSKYQLGIKATDEAVQNERRSSDTYISLLVTHSPNFVSQTIDGSVQENEPIGTTVLNVSLTDFPFDVEFYVTDIKTDDGKLSRKLFDIDIHTGVLSTTAVLDRESGVQAYEVYIYAAAGRSFHKTHIIKILVLHFVVHIILRISDSKSNILAMPLAEGQDKQVLYTISEYEPLLDSSNMGMSDWTRVAEDVKCHYENYDGFVVMHGTDTLCYTASALSFMLENLGKPVIITGAQISIFDTRSDARDNFLSALILAGNYSIPEVCVMFGRKLYRGNRTVKKSSEAFEAFCSPNFPPLADMAYSVKFEQRLVLPAPRESLRVQTPLCTEVGLLRIFPSMTLHTVRCSLAPPTRGLVFQTFGAGNVPCNRLDLIGAWAEAACRGILIVNITQCSTGAVTEIYETGSILYECGVISGYDMTLEAALCKLCYVLSKQEWDHETKKIMLRTDLRGELSSGISQKITCTDSDNIAKTVARILGRDACEDIAMVETALYPNLIQVAAFEGNLAKLQYLEKCGLDVIGFVDLQNGKTSLHAACISGKENVVRYLLQKGADINALDKSCRMPLEVAIENEQKDIISLLVKASARISYTSSSVSSSIISAVEREDVGLLECYRLAGVEIGKVTDATGRTAAHVAAFNKCCIVAQYLHSHGFESEHRRDRLGLTPQDYALKISQSP